MSEALDIFLARGTKEEGDRSKAYNDATGKTVTCQPGGNLSIGRGINLEVGLYPEEDAFLFRNRAGKVEAALVVYPWYGRLPPGVQSVLIDIGYNAGIGGLMHFPHMLAALAQEPPDYGQAADQCHVADPKLDASRYGPLRAILADGK